ncbi:MAG: hypothetical protein LT070_05945 [Solirubrobacteraceae bacterium]|nr:hypothetical protein [Solirubrobacteraceae bacterium]
MNVEMLYRPFEYVDAGLTELLTRAPLIFAIVIALFLGLRHASDPDHLAAVGVLIIGGGSDPRGGMRLGAWWGCGHGAVLLVLGIPLIVLRSSVPSVVEQAAERTIGAIIVLLAARVLFKWLRGDYRHLSGECHSTGGVGGQHCATAPAQNVRTARQSFVIGVLHGLGGTGAVVLLLLTSLPTIGAAMAALAVFVPASVLSMTMLSGGYSWVLTRPLARRLYPVVLPMTGWAGVMFGLAYARLI